jgi:serine/threonine protein kinase
MGNQNACQALCSKRNPNGDATGELVTRADFKVHCAIGRGGFGKVLRVSKNGEQFAMKEMLKARVMAKKSVDSVKKELELM